MLRRLGLIAVCAGIVASVGCDGGTSTAPATPTGPTPPPPAPPSPVAVPTTIFTVEFGGRVVNAEAGGPVANVRVSVGGWVSSKPPGWVFPTDTATSGGDGTFTLPLSFPSDWKMVYLEFTGPAGYDDTGSRFEPTADCALSPCWAAADRPAIGMYPTLVIRPGESIEVRVQANVNLCAFAGAIDCRRVLVEASPGEPVELELVPYDTSKPMALAKDDWTDVSSPRLLVAPGGVAYVHGPGTARLTARR